MRRISPSMPSPTETALCLTASRSANLQTGQCSGTHNQITPSPGHPWCAPFASCALHLVCSLRVALRVCFSFPPCLLCSIQQPVVRPELPLRPRHLSGTHMPWARARAHVCMVCMHVSCMPPEPAPQRDDSRVPAEAPALVGAGPYRAPAAGRAHACARGCPGCGCCGAQPTLVAGRGARSGAIGLLSACYRPATCLLQACMRMQSPWLCMLRCTAGVALAATAFCIHACTPCTRAPRRCRGVCWAVSLRAAGTQRRGRGRGGADGAGVRACGYTQPAHVCSVCWNADADM
jgi:hypothetical protein